MFKLSLQLSLLILAAMVAGCASIKQYQTLQQPLGRELRTYVGGTILKVVRQESLPNAFGRADAYGGRRPKGSVELKYLGVRDDGVIRLRVLSSDVTSTEDWRRRLGNKGSITSSSDAVDFDHKPEQAFNIEGIIVQFIRVDSSGVTYRLGGQLTRAR